jgi:hypothetical protein
MFCQSVLDQMRTRRTKAQDAVERGFRTAGYDGGKFVITEYSPEMAQASLDETDGAVAWLTVNAVVRPVVAEDSLAAGLRETLQMTKSTVFGDLVIAMQNDLLFVTDDLPTRHLGFHLGFNKSCWLHIALRYARDTRKVDNDRFISWSASLIDAGHTSTGATGSDIALALKMDARVTKFPGPLFSAFNRTVGGTHAEPNSHTRAVLECMVKMWADSDTEEYREAAASELLRQLLRTRHDDYAAILRDATQAMERHTDILQFMRYWAKGHFVPDHLRY